MKTRNSMTRTALLVVVAGAVLFVAQRAMTRSHHGNSTGATVTIDNFSFAPGTITVKAGTQVTWINHDDIPHTVVSSDQAFKSKVLDSDEKFTFTPDKPGTYSYFCSIHPKMTGAVVVE